MKSKKTSKSTKKESKNKTTLFQKFSLFFFKNKKLSLIGWLVILIFGLVTYTSLIQRQGFPSTQVPISIINGQYFVNDKNKVDSEVAVPVSNAIKEVDDVKEVTLTSTSNFANFVITYKDGVDAAVAKPKVQEAINKLNLPSQLSLSYENINAAKFANQYDLLVSAYQGGQNLNIQTLESQSQQLAVKLNELSSVESTQVIQQFKSAVDPSTGQQAQIQDSFNILGIKNEGSSELTFYQTVDIGVKFKEGQDSLKASDQINDVVTKFNKENQENLTARVSADFAPLIRSQVSSLQENMLEAFLIVALVSFILISWRAGLATALTMVTVLLTTVTLLYIFGMTLNVISLFALILSLGLIVDDSIIISEAIYAHRSDDLSRKEVVKEAIGRIGRASASGTLTTILAFAPMLFISGILGSFIYAIPVTIITSLALSLTFSLSLIPFFASGFLIPNKKAKASGSNPVQAAEKYLSEKVANLVRYVGSHRKPGAFIAIGLIILSLVATAVGGSYFQKTGFDILPQEKDSDQLVVSINYKPGSTIQSAVVQSQQVDAVLSSEAKNIKELSYYGSGTTQSSTLSIDLVDMKKREDTSIQITERLNNQFAKLKAEGILASASSSGAGGPSSDYPLKVEVFSPDTAKAELALQEIKSNIQNKEFQTQSGLNFKVDKTLVSDNQNLVQRIDGKKYASLSLGFNQKASTEVLDTVTKYVNSEFSPSQFGLENDSIQVNIGFEESNQDSFRSMMIVFPFMLLAMYLILALQFKSLLQPIFIFMAIPFSFLGVGAGLYYTNNSASFFVMLGFFALIGIAVNNTILITDYANQQRKSGFGRIESIASAIQVRFRPLITTSLTAVVALIPLALSDPFWQSLSVTLIFGLLSSTLLVIICFPYYLIAAESLRHLGRKSVKALKK